MSQLGCNQIEQLELFQVFTNICESNNIKYTVFGSTAFALKEKRGFSKYCAYINIGLLYDEFIKFKEIFMKVNTNSDYYILDSENGIQYDSVSMRLAKKSKVKLSEERVDDEKYYDFFINIAPIFYAGNTIKEYKKMRNNYSKHIKYYYSRKILRRKIKLSNFWKSALQEYRYSQRHKYPFERIKEELIVYGTTPTKYVFTPGLKKARGIARLAETYKNVEETEFEGYKCKIVKNSDEWLKLCYDKKQYDKIINKVVNRAAVVGPEIMRRIQLIELEMLIEIDRVCRENNINYTLGFGTLLGATRHKGFVPWDDDIDVCMPYEDYLKFIEIAPQKMDTERFFLRTQDTDKDCNLSFIQIKRNNTICCREARENFDSHKGVFVDIFPLFNGSNNFILHKIQNKVCMFYKTMIWSHMGAISEKRKFYRQYYMLLSKVSNKTAYKKFIKWATMFKRPTNKCIYLGSRVNPFNTVFTRKKTYENVVELQFEGRNFFVPEKYHEILECLYGVDYMRYPSMANRIAKHLPFTIEIGDLFIDLK